MSDEEIQTAIRDAERYAEEDQARRNAFEQRGHAQQLCNEAESILREQSKTLDKALKKDLKATSANVGKYLMKKPEKMKPADHDALNSAVDQLKAALARARG